MQNVSKNISGMTFFRTTQFVGPPNLFRYPFFWAFFLPTYFFCMNVWIVKSIWCMCNVMKWKQSSWDCACATERERTRERLVFLKSFLQLCHQVIPLLTHIFMISWDLIIAHKLVHKKCYFLPLEVMIQVFWISNFCWMSLFETLMLIICTSLPHVIT